MRCETRAVVNERTIELDLLPSDGRSWRVAVLERDLRRLGGDPGDWRLMWVHWSPGAVARLRVSGPDSEEMQRLVLEAADDLGVVRVGI